MDSVDVLIVGAGISGIGAAYYLQRDHPGRSYAILEARGASGGTWDLFRFPGVRSDSDLHTFGYEFRPWRSEVAIADAGSILAYLRETAAEYGIDRHIRYHTKVLAASWSSADARWTVTTENTETGEHDTVTCRWLLSASGYYRYDEGYTPHFEGRERFAGPIVHPQHWPADLDYAGKRVVVIGSGATAVTLIPAMAATAAHVTMLQRTPSYVLPVPTRDALNARLTAAARRRARVRDHPAAEHLPPGDALAAVPEVPRRRRARSSGTSTSSCCRRAIRSTSTSARRTARGTSGCASCPTVTCSASSARARRRWSPGTSRRSPRTACCSRTAGSVEADIIVTATGLNVQALGGIALTVDGEPVQAADRFVYKGMMLSGVPNFVFIFGYTNASWTLKVGLVGEHLTRLLRHMDARGYGTVTRSPTRACRRRRSPASAPGTSSARSTSSPARAAARRGGSPPPTAPTSSCCARGRVDDPELRF